LREALAGAGVPVELTADIRRVLWEKYLLISAQAGMTALTRCAVGVLRDIPECWAMYRRLLEELAAVARAAGIGLPSDVVERLLQAARELAPEAASSLHDDLVAGRRLELEALHGHATRLAARLGVPAPTVAAVYAALKPHAAGRRG
ncbi:MAG TPA: ketopantoate reductase C-terminal domain-containing protein, partial [Methylomirabilota bacterium]|nr:ketopantoate reductase C-terminal domain-containing protein [Methylomirabilota bacterium]